MNTVSDDEGGSVEDVVIDEPVNTEEGLKGHPLAENL